ncbi:uncharacterized protein ARMOST_12079 [Armillaria ostoyae]|uniref:Protein kinase domain-containing protein n=1 Tax=Armillaria ostoyae TaxID=47428 RepID=A0A284RIX4_ARMOS|nr:uncharacterized protein ARMOST_12079 [Armillaria ostoyae]
MDQPPPTWRDFLDIRFQHHLRLDEISSTHNIHPYPAIAPPPTEKSLRQSDPDPTVVPRILESFHSFLRHKGWLDQPLPPRLADRLESFQEDLSASILSSEVTVGILYHEFFAIVREAIKALSSTPAQPITVIQLARQQEYLEEGSLNWTTIDVPTRTGVKTTMTTVKRPRVLFHHAKDMQKEHRYGPLDPQYDAKAMCIKAWLQLSTNDPVSEHKVIFSGLSAVILEKSVYASNHHGLLVSPHYHLFCDDNPPTSAEYPFIDELNRCEKGIPLFAVMTYLMLPDTSVRKGVLPSIRNPITPHEKAVQSDAQGPRETLNTRDGTAVAKMSMISLKFDHPDVTRLPRLLYAQVLHDDPSDDTPPLSFSSIRSASFNVQLYQRIHIGNFAQVWRGSLTNSNGTVVSVVAKMYSRRYFEAMDKETRAYRLLSRHHLDNLAPVYYGTFTMPGESWGAVILSDVGEAFHCYSWDEAGMSAEELRTIWNHANGLHSVGLHHHDLEPRNVAKDGDGTLRILDFELSSLDKSCSCGELESLGQVFDSLMEWR